jgi:NTP pyrophosphatase (non-canonical NTP hydrolase)
MLNVGGTAKLTATLDVIPGPRNITFGEFDEGVKRTARAYDSQAKALSVFGLGIAGEAGEVADLIKKIVGHDHPLDEATRDKLIKELGDVQFYAAAILDQLGSSSEESAWLNREKLRERYPNGFEAERSRNRGRVELDQLSLPAST